MPVKGVMAEIKSLLAEGKTKQDLIASGFARGSVYSAARQLTKEGTRPNPKSTTASDSQLTLPRPSASLPADAEIADLQRTIQTTRLQNELAKLRGDSVSLEELKVMMYRLQEWVVRNMSDMGQCIVLLQGEEPKAEAFEDFVRESLAELRTP